MLKICQNYGAIGVKRGAIWLSNLKVLVLEN